jgi:hypothetical protein
MIAQRLRTYLIKYKRWVVSAGVAGLLGVVVLWMFWPLFGIGRVSYYRIRAGMSLEEVEGIIGLPPGDYYPRRRGVGGFSAAITRSVERQAKGISWTEIPVSWRYREHDPHVPGQGCVKRWQGEFYDIAVAFDESGQVVAWKFFEVVEPSRGFFHARAQLAGSPSRLASFAWFIAGLSEGCRICLTSCAFFR